MITAAGLADALAPLVELVGAGTDRPVLGLEVVEPGGEVPVERGDLAVVVGARTVDDVARTIEHAGAAAGLVLRRPWAGLPEVRDGCARAGLALLSTSDDTPWSSVLTLLRTALASAAATGSGPADHVYGDLFDMADTVGSIVGAPVTVEDATSRVLAYSTGQEDVDEARMTTIVGRRVPRARRDHFRALGVFRRLARSDEPFLVPAGGDGLKARYVIPVRAGQEWLGSVWAVLDTPPRGRERELRAATEVIALYLLRLRAQSELQHQVQVDQVRALLRGRAAEHPRWLDPGPWRVAALGGPSGDLTAEARCELWVALARRQGWRRPLVADLDDEVYALLRTTDAGPGSWAWTAALAREGRLGDATTRVVAGAPVDAAEDLGRSRAQADELGRLDPALIDHPVATVETSWAAVVLARALTGLDRHPPVSPLADLLAHEREHGGALVDTLAAVVDHWGEPRRAAQALGVHPNTVRYRTARLRALCAVDLDDPAQRLAVRLEIARHRSAG